VTQLGSLTGMQSSINMSDDVAWEGSEWSTCRCPPQRARYPMTEREPTPIPTAFAVEAMYWVMEGKGYVGQWMN